MFEHWKSGKNWRKRIKFFRENWPGALKVLISIYKIFKIILWLSTFNFLLFVRCTHGWRTKTKTPIVFTGHFCWVWCSNFVDSESGQKQSVKLHKIWLQHISTPPPPLPAENPPPSVENLPPQRKILTPQQRYPRYKVVFAWNRSITGFCIFLLLGMSMGFTMQSFVGIGHSDDFWRSAENPPPSAENPSPQGKILPPQRSSNRCFLA
jgi:hypothetical protein